MKCRAVFLHWVAECAVSETATNVYFICLFATNVMVEVNILKEDQPYVLKLLMEAISEVDTNPEQSLVVTLTKFGQ